MTIKPDREEWLAARKRLSDHRGVDARNAILETILGPCPPEPAPEPFRGKDARVLVRVLGPGRISIPATPGHALTPDEADAMACSLIEHAAYAREQASLGVSPLCAPEKTVCGALLVGRLGMDPALGWSCVRPKDHSGGHGPRWLAGDDGPELPLCGNVLDTFQFSGDDLDNPPTCQRPENHPGVCASYRLAGDDG